MTYKLDPWSRVVYYNQYTITPDYTTRNEGTSVVFTITTTNVANGTVVYWRLEGVTGNITNADFTSPANPLTTGGSVTINNNTANFTVSISADVTTEGTESFCAKVYKDSAFTTLKATSATVTVLDTSIAGQIGDVSVGLPIRDIDWNPTGDRLAVLHDSSLTALNYATIFNVSGSATTLSTKIGTTWDTEYLIRSRGTIDYSPDGTKLLIVCSSGLGWAYGSGNVTEGVTDHQYIYERANVEIWSGTSTRLFAAGYGGFNPTDFQSPYQPNGWSATYAEGGRWISSTDIGISQGQQGAIVLTPWTNSYIPQLAYTYKQLSSTTSKIWDGRERMKNSGSTFLFYQESYNTFTAGLKKTNVSTGTTTVLSAPGAFPPSTPGFGYNDSDLYSLYTVSGWEAYPDSSARELYLHYGSGITGSAVSEDSSNTFNAQKVCFKPDGTKVAVSRGDSTRGTIVQIYSRSGGTLTYESAVGKSNNSGSIVKMMVWNPQGTKLAVVYSNGSNPDSIEIYLV